MKTISVKQPWAAAILDGLKDIEVRTWTPNPGIIAPGTRIAIHASKEASSYTGCLPAEWLMKAELVYGAVLGVVMYLGSEQYRTVKQFSEDVRRHYNNPGDFELGKFGWEFSNPVWLPYPFPCKGQLGFFDAPVIRGVCSVCGCTENRACNDGCYWVNEEHMLCSECDESDILPGINSEASRR